MLAMTVKQLREELARLPEDLEVWFTNNIGDPLEEHVRAHPVHDVDPGHLRHGTNRGGSYARVVESGRHKVVLLSSPP